MPLRKADVGFDILQCFVVAIVIGGAGVLCLGVKIHWMRREVENG